MILVDGQTHEGNEETGVKWHHVLLMNRAAMREQDIVIIEAFGLPLRYKSRSTLEVLVRPFGTVFQICSDGLEYGDQT